VGPMSAGRRVLVTGCSRGIGRATALALAARGWRVTGTLRGEEGRADLEAAGVAIAHLDLLRDPEAAVRAAIDREGGLDALVANAGAGLFGCFEDQDEADLREQLEVNFFGPVACARAALPALRAQRGRLVLVSSIAGRRGAPGSSAYNAAKFALEGWGEAVRHELGPFGVKLVLVEPGPTESGFSAARRRAARAGSGPYAPLTAALERLHGRMRAREIPVDSAVAAIVEALEASRPPLRIVPGTGARFELAAARAVPWSLWEALVRWQTRV